MPIYKELDKNYACTGVVALHTHFSATVEELILNCNSANSFVYTQYPELAYHKIYIFPPRYQPTIFYFT